MEGAAGRRRTESARGLPARGAVAGGPFKFTVTSPYMLARTLLDLHYGDFERLTMAIADVLAEQVRGLPVRLPAGGRGEHSGQSGATARSRQRRSTPCWTHLTGEKAVHLCFGNYGGQTIQKGEWKALLGFLNALHADHVVLELAHRPASDLEAFREVDPAHLARPRRDRREGESRRDAGRSRGAHRSDRKDGRAGTRSAGCIPIAVSGC